MAVWSEGSTWKHSAMQLVAISMLSASSGWSVPSLREVERKSTMPSARRLRDSSACEMLALDNFDSDGHCPTMLLLVPD